jgi:hypothetical protein
MQVVLGRGSILACLVFFRLAIDLHFSLPSIFTKLFWVLPVVLLFFSQSDAGSASGGICLCFWLVGLRNPSHIYGWFRHINEICLFCRQKYSMYIRIYLFYLYGITDCNAFETTWWGFFLSEQFPTFWEIKLFYSLNCYWISETSVSWISQSFHQPSYAINIAWWHPFMFRELGAANVRELGAADVWLTYMSSCPSKDGLFVGHDLNPLKLFFW